MWESWYRRAGILAGLAGLAGLASVAGCRQARDPGQPPVLRVSFSLEESEWAVFREQIFPEFERRCACRVEAVQIDAADLPKLLQVGRHAGRYPVDLFAQDNMQLAVLVRDGLVRDLSALQTRIPPEVYPAMLEAGRFNGTLYFIPFRPNVQIFYYNRAKFEEYGLQPPRSWQEWLDVATVFHAREGVGRVLIKGVGGAVTVTQFYEYLVAAGADPFAFNDEGSRRTYAFFRELWKVASPDSRRAKWDTSNDYLARDSVYLMQNWPFGYKILTEQYGKRDIGVYAGFPGPVREAHVIGGDVFGIPVGSARADLAEQFIAFMLSRDAQAILVRELGWPSVRSDVRDQAGSPLFQAVSQALAHGVFRRNVPYWAEYQKLTEEAFLRLVVNGEPLSLLDEFHDRMQAISAAYE